MKNVINFLRDIRTNNNRPWFELNKARYKEALGQFNEFSLRLIEGIASFDPTVEGLGLRDCTYRIYRDVRFSKNKDPYKSHMGVYVCRGGKKSSYAGYYFHVEPFGKKGTGEYFMSGGIYMPEPKILRSLREEIDDNGEAIEKNIALAKGFTLGEGETLKRLPAGFPVDHPFAEYLKKKDFYLQKSLTEKDILSADLVDLVVDSYRLVKPFLDQLNMAVDYALEEM